jgi:toxin FitB
VTVLDTNVFSELLKPAPSETVMNWLGTQNRSSVFITAVGVAELLHGVELLPHGKRRSGLLRVIEETLAVDFAARILSFDASAARLYAAIRAGRSAMGRPISQSDAMIAAIARAQGLTLATRNTSDFEECGVRLVNPWL